MGLAGKMEREREREAGREEGREGRGREDGREGGSGRGTEGGREEEKGGMNEGTLGAEPDSVPNKPFSEAAIVTPSMTPETASPLPPFFSRDQN